MDDKPIPNLRRDVLKQREAEQNAYSIEAARQRAIRDANSWRHESGKAEPASGGAMEAQQVHVGPSQSVQVHRAAGGRVDLLRPVIERAQALAGAASTAAEVWAQLERLACEERPAPLEGANSGGIQFRDGNKKRTFTKGALRDRLRRAARRGKTL